MISKFSTSRVVGFRRATTSSPNSSDSCPDGGQKLRVPDPDVLFPFLGKLYFARQVWTGESHLQIPLTRPPLVTCQRLSDFGPRTPDLFELTTFSCFFRGRPAKSLGCHKSEILNRRSNSPSPVVRHRSAKCAHLCASRFLRNVLAHTLLPRQSSMASLRPPYAPRLGRLRLQVVAPSPITLRALWVNE